jgi:hypothetical protein
MVIEEENIRLIFFIIIITFFIIYLISFVVRSTTYDYPIKSEYLDMREFNNGDVVCVSYYNVAGAIVTSASHSIWSHTGTIWVDPVTNVRYVLEGAIYRMKKYQHFFKIPLETWLFFNKKSLLGYKKYHGPEISSEFLWSKFEWLVKKCKLESFSLYWARFIADKDYYEYSRKDKYTCLEATIILGQNAGIYKKDKIYCSYFPGSVANNEISLCDGVSYDLPIKIALHPTNKMLIDEDISLNVCFWKN